VVDYLATPPGRDELRDMIARAGLTVREAMRSKEAAYGELGLDDPALSDDALLDAMVANPVLINRPFVVTPKGVRLCRPPELVRDIL
jgi:arsenate reductase